VTLGLVRAEQPELSDATAIAASIGAPAAFSRVFERHHAAVHPRALTGAVNKGRWRDRRQFLLAHFPLEDKLYSKGPQGAKTLSTRPFRRS
jgi:hypothetical protein